MTLEDQITQERSTARVHGLLVATSALLAVVEARDLLTTLHCERVLLSPAKMWEHAVDDDWIVIECYDPCENVANLLSRAMSRVEHLFPDLAGPFLFVGHPRSDIPDIGTITDTTLRFEESDDGELTLLAVGAAIASTGLLGDFFKLVREHKEVDGHGLVDLLAVALDRTPG